MEKQDTVRPGFLAGGSLVGIAFLALPVCKFVAWACSLPAFEESWGVTLEASFILMFVTFLTIALLHALAKRYFVTVIGVVLGIQVVIAPALGIGVLSGYGVSMRIAIGLGVAVLGLAVNLLFSWIEVGDLDRD